MFAPKQGFHTPDTPDTQSSQRMGKALVQADPPFPSADFPSLLFTGLNSVGLYTGIYLKQVLEMKGTISATVSVCCKQKQHPRQLWGQ